MPALCPKPISQGQLDDAVILYHFAISGVHREPQFDSLSQIGSYFLLRLALGDAPRQGWNLSPKAAFFGLVNDRLYFHAWILPETKAISSA